MSRSALHRCFQRYSISRLPLNEDGVQFTLQPYQWFQGGHSFARICRAYGVEHRLTKPAHPWD